MKLSNDQRNILTIAAVGAVAFWFLSVQVKKAAVVVGDAINPINHDNIFNQGANSLFTAITGDSTNTFGTWLYEKLNPETDFSFTVDNPKQPGDKNKVVTPPLLQRPETMTPGVEDFLKDIYKVPKS